MTKVLILLAALNGYHGTKLQCATVTEALYSFVNLNLIYGTDRDVLEGKRNSSNVDATRKAIHEFNKKCRVKK